MDISEGLNCNLELHRAQVEVDRPYDCVRREVVEFRCSHNRHRTYWPNDVADDRYILATITENAIYPLERLSCACPAMFLRELALAADIPGYDRWNAAIVVPT